MKLKHFLSLLLILTISVSTTAKEINQPAILDSIESLSFADENLDLMEFDQLEDYVFESNDISIEKTCFKSFSVLDFSNFYVKNEANQDGETSTKVNYKDHGSFDLPASKAKLNEDIGQIVDKTIMSRAQTPRLMCGFADLKPPNTRHVPFLKQ